jgi:hypothetical protein
MPPYIQRFISGLLSSYAVTVFVLTLICIALSVVGLFPVLLQLHKWVAFLPVLMVFWAVVPPASAVVTTLLIVLAMLIAILIVMKRSSPSVLFGVLAGLATTPSIFVSVGPYFMK